ncbi:MAG: hypothetical protein R6V00_04675 [Candidatus Aminicenantes bacterium]
MSKKNLFKAVSLVVVFSVLALSFPTTVNAKPNNDGFTFSQLLKEPVQFFISLFPFLQKNSQQRPDRYDNSEQDTENTVQKTGDLDRLRPSRG